MSLNKDGEPMARNGNIFSTALIDVLDQNKTKLHKIHEFKRTERVYQPPPPSPGD